MCDFQCVHCSHNIRYVQFDITQKKMIPPHEWIYISFLNLICFYPLKLKSKILIYAVFIIHLSFMLVMDFVFFND